MIGEGTPKIWESQALPFIPSLRPILQALSSIKSSTQGGYRCSQTYLARRGLTYFLAIDSHMVILSTCSTVTLHPARDFPVWRCNGALVQVRKAHSAKPENSTSL